MDTFDAIYKRRAIKHYDPEHRFTKEEETKLLEAAIQSPTSFNIQHWRFVILRDPELRKKIRTELGNDQSQMTDASLLVLMTADTQAWAKQPERYWCKAPQEVQDFVVPAIGQYYQGRAQVQRDEGMRSCGLVGMSMMLLAK